VGANAAPIVIFCGVLRFGYCFQRDAAQTGDGRGSAGSIRAASADESALQRRATVACCCIRQKIEEILVCHFDRRCGARATGVTCPGQFFCSAWSRSFIPALHCCGARSAAAGKAGRLAAPLRGVALPAASTVRDWVHAGVDWPPVCHWLPPLLSKRQRSSPKAETRSAAGLGRATQWGAR
jgi:hypothetical protein